MSSSRKRRRRMERERANRPVRSRSLNLISRIGLAFGGIVLVVVGSTLLTLGSPGTEARIGRLAGILILVGIVLVAMGVLGRL